jgi:ferritin-like metal-binding protein YciE
MKNKQMLQNIAHYGSDESRELRGLFEKQLKELYWTEGAVASLLDDTVVNCRSKDLIMVLKRHKDETLNHVSRLEKIFRAIGIGPALLAYRGMECLLEEVRDDTSHIKAGVVRDAAIIAVLQKIKHYEIACYGTMRAHAIALREEDVVTLLELTLEEEKAADHALSHIAESHINIEAADKEL